MMMVLIALFEIIVSLSFSCYKKLTILVRVYVFQLDTANYPFPNTLWHIKPVDEIALKTTSMLIVGVCGIFFNFVILLIISKNKWLWSTSNYLIANMAFVDFLTLLLCPWFMLVRDFYQNYVLGMFGCQFEGFIQGKTSNI